MTDQRDLEELRQRLLVVLRERLAEAEDDEARQAAWEATNWDLVAGDPCPRCSKPSLRFRDGVCLPCVADLVKQADRKERFRLRYLGFAKSHNARADRLNKRGPARAGPPMLREIETLKGAP